MLEQFSRTELLLGKTALERLAQSRVAIFGVGGVGGYVVEALARGGVGTLDLIDNDTVCLSNINRQIIATHKTIGQLKVDAAKQRVLDINPSAVVNTYPTFYLPENKDQFDFSQYDYIVDAIDTVTAKLALIQQAGEIGVPIISSMGTGNKVDPSRLQIADIYDTSVCPLARVMRTECRKRGIRSLKVVYSQEPALRPIRLSYPQQAQNGTRRDTPGSTSFVPSVAGLLIAGEVLRTLSGFPETREADFAALKKEVSE